MTARTIRALVALVAVAAVVVAAVVVVRHYWTSGDSSSSYCNQVSANEAELSSVASSNDSQTALIKALPVFESLASSAPDDISASWTALNTAIAGLKSAIAATGHKPTDFANGVFPKDVTPAQRQAIVAAADTLGSSTTTTALSSIVQEIRDVCQVDLNL